MTDMTYMRKVDNVDIGVETEETYTGFRWESLKGKDHFEDQGIDGRMSSKWTLGRLARGDVEWIHLDQDRDCWQALVNAVMNLRVLVQ
jgi:hypothetical protein